MDSNDLLLHVAACCWRRIVDRRRRLSACSIPISPASGAPTSAPAGVTETQVQAHRQARAGETAAEPAQAGLRDSEGAGGRARRRARRSRMRLRLQRAGLDISPRSFWIASVRLRRRDRWRSVIWLSRRRTCRSSCRSLAAFVGVVRAAALVRCPADEAPADQVHRRVRQRHRRRSCAASSPACRCPNALASSRAKVAEPLAGEFTELVEQQRVGVPLGEAFERMMTRMPLAGGALLRHRHRHPAAGRRQPVGGARQPLGRAARPQAPAGQGASALSAEAKASAAVLGVAAVHRHDPRLHHRRPTTSRRCGPRRLRPVPAGCAPASG